MRYRWYNERVFCRRCQEHTQHFQVTREHVACAECGNDVLGVTLAVLFSTDDDQPHPRITFPRRLHLHETD